MPTDLKIYRWYDSIDEVKTFRYVYRRTILPGAPDVTGGWDIITPDQEIALPSIPYNRGARVQFYPVPAPGALEALNSGKSLLANLLG